jgi:hypothetical protein
VLREPFVDELIPKRDAAAPCDAEIAAVSVAVMEAMPDKVERALIDEDKEASRGTLPKRPFGGAFGALEFGRVDPDQPHSALPEAERVAVDNAGHASPFAAARECRLDPLGLPGDRTHRRNDRRIEKRAGQRKQKN